MQNEVMFIVGIIVFSLYLVGYLFMIKRQNELQQEQSKKRTTQAEKAMPDADDENTKGAALSS